MQVDAPIVDRCSRLIGYILERDLTCGGLQHSRTRPQACGQMVRIVSNSAGASLIRFHVSGACARALGGLHMLGVCELTSSRSGVNISSMLVTTTTVSATCSGRAQLARGESEGAATDAFITPISAVDEIILAMGARVAHLSLIHI